MCHARLATSLNNYSPKPQRSQSLCTDICSQRFGSVLSRTGKKEQYGNVCMQVGDPEKVLTNFETDALLLRDKLKYVVSQAHEV